MNNEKKISKRKWVLIASLMLALVMVFVPSSKTIFAATESEVRIIKIAMAESQNSRVYQSTVQYCDEISFRSNGALQYEIYPNGSLYSNEWEMFEALQNGALDMAWLDAEVIYRYTGITELRALQAPFTMTLNAVDVIYRDPQINDTIQQKIRNAGLGIVCIGMVPSDAQMIISSRPVETLDDLQGLHIRINANEMIVRAFENLGAYPVSIPRSDLYDSLENGVIDAALVDIVQDYYNGNLFEVARYYNRTPVYYKPKLFCASENFINSLSQDEQAIITQSFDVLSDCYYSGTWADIFDQLEKKGTISIEFSDEELERIRDRLGNIYDEFRDCEDFFQRIREIVAQYP